MYAVDLVRGQLEGCRGPGAAEDAPMMPRGCGGMGSCGQGLGSGGGLGESSVLLFFFAFVLF